MIFCIVGVHSCPRFSNDAKGGPFTNTESTGVGPKPRRYDHEPWIMMLQPLLRRRNLCDWMQGRGCIQTWMSATWNPMFQDALLPRQGASQEHQTTPGTVRQPFPLQAPPSCYLVATKQVAGFVEISLIRTARCLPSSCNRRAAWK
ncbi:hypothetical protein PILCRDRAFT_291953 [Piloderma croceum F 1598]|uniref:Uncharacterized protein n=1 Tax=Piloderma croceum (strain F 1598) TaxID=765440 RepID=A0A0C3G8C8_PILCF|nr:hypothetical protein PILCRDRAFT_291953 [Piloderma croceum F 1598]